MPSSNGRAAFSRRRLLALAARASWRTALFGLLACLFGLATPACCRFGADEAASDGGPPPPPTAEAGAAVNPTSTADPGAAAGSPTAPSAAPGGREIVGAAHILIAYKGAELAPKEVTRSKADARKRAEEVLAKLKADQTKLPDLAKTYSDDASKVTGGAIGNFERNAMPPAFSDAAFGLEVGALSEIIETPRGFHIIQRTR